MNKAIPVDIQYIYLDELVNTFAPVSSSSIKMLSIVVNSYKY